MNRNLNPSTAAVMSIYFWSSDHTHDQSEHSSTSTERWVVATPGITGNFRGVVCSDISWEATDLLSGGLDQTCFHGYGLNTAACIGNWNRKGRIASSVC